MKTFLTIPLLLLPLLTMAQPSPQRTIDLFETYITGDFTNQRQVEAEVKAGKQVHPLARHVNRRADAKIQNAPPRDGFWLLEESYYEYPGKPLEAKPYLFFFEAVGDTAVRLSVYKFPENLPPDALKNGNANLRMNFSDLNPSPTFKGALYQRRGDTFTTHAPNDLGNGMRFTLIETFTKDRLEVMELLEKNGQRLTPYDTPIVYDRMRR